MIIQRDAYKRASIHPRVTRPTYHEVLRVCLPLVLSLSATTVMEFTDRVFLANYAIEAISAAVPAGISSYLFIAFFGGVGGYTGVFIAQYTGRGDHQNIGSVLWQGIYFTLFSGVLLWLLAIFFTQPLFALAGHEAAVRHQEELYFSILCKGAVLHVAMATLSTFFSGRGLTRPVMVVTIIGVVMNIPLDYALIFGRWGLPEMGIRGAGYATVAAWAINVLLLALLIFTRKNNASFGVFSRIAFNAEIFKRLMRFGIPGALQFTLDIFAFTIFILLIGRISTEALAATNIVLSINALTFMPSMGVSQGVSVLVGQALGRSKPEQAEQFAAGAARLLFCYILLVDLFFIFTPNQVLAPFLSSATSPGGADSVGLIAVQLLKIVAVYLFFDGLYMVYSGALRGAGDTRFMTAALAIASPVVLIIPAYVSIEYLHCDAVTAWLWILVFVTVLFLISILRYRFGAWKKMLVIEGRQSDLSAQSPRT